MRIETVLFRKKKPVCLVWICQWCDLSRIPVQGSLTFIAWCDIARSLRTAYSAGCWCDRGSTSNPSGKKLTSVTGTRIDGSPPALVRMHSIEMLTQGGSSALFNVKSICILHREGSSEPATRRKNLALAGIFRRGNNARWGHDMIAIVLVLWRCSAFGSSRLMRRHGPLRRGQPRALSHQSRVTHHCPRF